MTRSEGGPQAAPGTRLRPLSIEEINQGANALLEEALGSVWVSGELSRLVRHRSGHWYFTLKDDRASVSCAMFRGRNARVRFTPEDGMELLALVSAGIYAPQGRYQLIVQALEARGEGARALALEQLRRRLAAEGLFDEERKQALPRLPAKIGVLTSATGAALQDVLRVLRRRFSGVEVLVAPTAVQGSDALDGLVQGLARLDGRSLDLILIVRGGGAREDLATFDEERLVRAIASCSTPIVTGIGHEIDTTLADLAADLRAATPSAAAELVVREQSVLRAQVIQLRLALARNIRYSLESKRSDLRHQLGSRGMSGVPLRLERLRTHITDLSFRQERSITRALGKVATRLAETRSRFSPESLRRGLLMRRARRDALASRMREAMGERLDHSRHRFAVATARIDALSPLSVLSRGYSLAQNATRGGVLVDDARKLRKGDKLLIQFAHGRADTKVTNLHLPEDAGPETSP